MEEEKLRVLLEDAKQENSSLQGRVTALEEDIETEKARSVRFRYCPWCCW